MRFRPIAKHTQDGPGLLADFETYLTEVGDDFFGPSHPITVARAPARLDCMGGIADYSGSLVFESTLGRAAVVAFQPREDGVLRARSALLERQNRPCEAEFGLDDFRRNGDPIPYEDARELFASRPEGNWSAYIIGALYVLEKEGLFHFDNGADMLLWSDIPMGVGVASSAALEVAAMYATVGALGLDVDGVRLAELAQIVENRVVGAPCGIMDQVTSALGEEHKLLALQCQPCDVQGQHELPENVRLFGISSRVEHSVGGAAYTRTRIGAFMGLKIILNARRDRGVQPADEDYYLCNVPPEDFRSEYRELLPGTIRGEDFLESHGPTTDSVTSVDPSVEYAVLGPTEHPVYENQRVRSFMECIDRARTGDRTALVEAGGLMYASHSSYSWNCNMGCDETDLIVRLVRQRGPEQGLYGAKITGGGSGGTVAILADAEAEEKVREVAEEYEKHTGNEPDLFDRSSPGAYAFGHQRYRPERAD